MIPEGNQRFDVETLRKWLGERAFARGEGCYRNGQVTLLSVERERVVARVTGTEDYRIELTASDRQISGTCTCPASRREPFCKHMIAVALAANARGSEGEEDSLLARIRRHLASRDAATLVDMIMDLAERDAALLRRLELSAAASNLDGKAKAEPLHQMLDRAIGTVEDFYDVELSDWVDGVGEALDVVADLLPAGRPELAIKLTNEALGQLELIRDQFDDYDGDVEDLLHRARDIHLAGARLAPPEPLAFARELLAREIDDRHEIFYGAIEDYADVLGEVGLMEYRRLATDAWQKLPTPSRPAKPSFESSREQNILRNILDFFAERDGDVDARVALRSRDLSSPWQYLELAKFCLEHGREDEALRRAEDGLWMFEDGQPDERLLLFAVGLLTKAGRTADAEKRLWQAFEKAPSATILDELRKRGGAAARDRALLLLEASLAYPKAAGRSVSPDFLLGILVEEKLFERAWAVARSHRVSSRYKEHLARQSEATHPDEALAVYAARVEELAMAGGDLAYDEAAQLVARMAGLRDAAAQAAYVADLKLRYARRRNLIKRLG